MSFGAPTAIIRPGATISAALVGPRGKQGEDGESITGPTPWTLPAAWAPFMTCVVGPPATLVTVAGSSYVCIVPHTATDFAADLASGFWAQIVSIGLTGKPGSVWYKGSGVPAATTGVTGDYWFQTDTADVFCRTDAGWGQPVANIRGIKGDTGNSILWGSGAPSNTLGRDGDSYIDAANTRLYGPKAGGAWPAGSISLVGSGNGNVNPQGAFTVGHIVIAGTTDGEIIQDGGPLGASGGVALYDDPRIAGAVSASTLAAATADVSVNTQNLLYQGLLIAALRNVPTGLVDGILDPFSSLADINTGASSGYTFSGAAGTIGQTPTSAGGVTVSTAATAVALQTGQGTPGAAFDGSTTTFWAGTRGASNQSGVEWIGQDFGASPKAIGTVVYTAYNAVNAIASALVQYSDDLVTWTTATTATLNTGGQSVTNIAVPSVGAHRAWRLLANANASNSNPWAVADIAMQTAASTAGPVTLQSATLASAVASPSAMRALIQVDVTSAALTPNTDLIVALSRDGGTTFATGTLSLVQRMPDGTTIYDTGWLNVSGQPTGNATMTYKITAPTAKAIVLTGVAMQVRP